MKWSRIKDIILGMLLVVNLILLGLVIQRRQEVVRYEDGLRSGTVAVLRQNNIAVAQDIVPWEDVDSAWALVRNTGQEQAAAQGGEFFANIAGFYLVYGLSMALRGFLEGLGDVLYSGLTGIGCLGVRIALSYALASWAGWRIIAWAEAVSWCLMLILYWVRYLTKGRRLTRDPAA